MSVWFRSGLADQFHVAAICAAGVVVVLLLPIADTTLPTVLATGVVIVFALYTYAGMAKLPH